MDNTVEEIKQFLDRLFKKNQAFWAALNKGAITLSKR
jgi:hypothetical protein